MFKSLLLFFAALVIIGCYADDIKKTCATGASTPVTYRVRHVTTDSDPSMLSELISIAERSQEVCRTGNPKLPRTRAACFIRERLGTELESRGICYRGDAMAESTGLFWRECYR